MDMQAKLYATQFFSPPDDRFGAWKKKVWTPSQEKNQTPWKTEKLTNLLLPIQPY